MRSLGEPEVNRGAQQTQMGGGGVWIQQLLLIMGNHPLLVDLSSSLAAVHLYCIPLLVRLSFNFLFSRLPPSVYAHPSSRLQHISVKVSILDWTVQDRLFVSCVPAAVCTETCRPVTDPWSGCRPWEIYESPTLGLR